MSKTWARVSKEDAKTIQTAKIHLMGIGKYAFITSLFGEPWELNMNMPSFDTEAEAVAWIEQSGKWQETKAALV